MRSCKGVRGGTGLVDEEERAEEDGGMTGRVDLKGETADGEVEPELLEDGGDDLVWEGRDGHVGGERRGVRAREEEEVEAEEVGRSSV